MDAWNFPHEPRGTCVKECPKFGLCHCGCEQPAKIANRNYVPRTEVKGMPRVWLNGHWEKHRLLFRQGRFGCFTKTGIPVEEVRRKIQWLRNLYADKVGPTELPEMMGLSYGSWNTILYSKTAINISPENAKKVDEFYEQHFRGGRVVRFPTKWEREEYKRASNAEAYMKGH